MRLPFKIKRYQDVKKIVLFIRNAKEISHYALFEVLKVIKYF